MLQYFNIDNILGLEKSAVARTIVGAHFSWSDMIAYALGIFVVLLIEF